jgi:hypothetical protein
MYWFTKGQSYPFFFFFFSNWYSMAMLILFHNLFNQILTSGRLCFSSFARRDLLDQKLCVSMDFARWC